MKKIGLVMMCLFGLGGCGPTDPCAGGGGACVTLDVSGDVGELDGVAFRFRGPIDYQVKAPMPAGARTLPARFGIFLPPVLSASLDVLAIAETGGRPVGRGQSLVSLREDGRGQVDLLLQPLAVACSDGIQNGDEAGIDCGGTCGPCSAPPGPPQCSAECTAGQTSCAAGQVRRCEAIDGCLRWSRSAACGTDEICSTDGARCVPTDFRQVYAADYTKDSCPAAWLKNAGAGGFCQGDLHGAGTRVATFPVGGGPYREVRIILSAKSYGTNDGFAHCGPGRGMVRVTPSFPYGDGIGVFSGDRHVFTFAHGVDDPMPAYPECGCPALGGAPAPAEITGAFACLPAAGAWVKTYDRTVITRRLDAATTDALQVAIMTDEGIGSEDSGVAALELWVH